MNQPLTDEQLNQIEARAKAALHCPNAEANGRLDGQHTFSGSFSHIRCELCTYTRPRGERVEETAMLLAEVRRLRDELAREERLHGETIDDRDRIHEAADKLAYAVAPIEVIGEHSSMNDPWENALDHLTPAAEVAKLRAEVATLEDDSALLAALQAAGVDNWEGYDDALTATP